MGELGFCNINDILKEALRIIITDISSDTGVPFWLIKLMHNKPLIFLTTSLHCYQLYLDFNKLVLFVSPFLYPLIFFGLFQKRGRKIILAVTLLLPIIFILNPLGWNLGSKISLYKQFFWFLSLIGLVKLLFALITRYQRIKISHQSQNQ